MDWLITFKNSVDTDEIAHVLTEAGCAVDVGSPIPLGETEQVVTAEGPSNLPDRLRDDDRVLKVSPNSSLTLY